MENSHKKQIAAAVQQYLTDYGLSQADIAKKSGVRKEYLTYILNGVFTYNAGADKKGNIADKYFYNLAKFIGFATQKSYWETKPTNQFVKSLSVLNDAKQHADTRLLIGQTGSGKTYAVDKFCLKNPTDTFKITVGSSDNLNDLINKIIEKLNITTGKTKSKKIRDIVKYLSDLKADGKTPMLIFDEAEYMKQPALCSVKELYDGLDKQCAIVMVGTDQLTENLHRLRKRNKNGIPQFYRRVKFGIRVLERIDTAFKLFLNDIEDKELIRWLKVQCENYGELHDVLVPCKREAEQRGETLSLGFVQQVIGFK